MTAQEIALILDEQRKFFLSGETLPIKFRIQMLKKLYASVISHKEEILSALTSDLGKSDFEGFMCEVGLSLTEISYMIKNVKK